MSLKRCYELTNSFGKVIRLIEDSKALILTCYTSDAKSIEIVLTSDEIDELTKSIDMLRPERSVVKKEIPRGGGK